MFVFLMFNRFMIFSPSSMAWLYRDVQGTRLDQCVDTNSSLGTNIRNNVLMCASNDYQIELV